MLWIVIGCRALPRALAVRPLLLGRSRCRQDGAGCAAAGVLDTDLIRLQAGAGGEPRALRVGLARKCSSLHLEASDDFDADRARHDLYSDRFLIRRPLLQAIDPARTRPAVLLIDEIDRADQEFEGFLLELLAEFQVTVPELGSIRAGARPLVILTSNRTREVHDALKRRCLYHWIEYPSFEKELAIVSRRAPSASQALARQVTAVVQELRASDLYKKPGVSETSDWLEALVALDVRDLDPALVDQTLGVVLKAKEDLDALRERCTADVLDRAMARAAVSR